MVNAFLRKQFNKAYENDAMKSAVYGASPTGLVVMLYQGALKALLQAGIAMEHKKYEEKARYINKTNQILEGLRLALDLEAGSEAADNLNELYVYMKYRISIANMKNDQSILAEVRDLLETILPAWQQLDRKNHTTPAA
ncbi:flagellar export chaperone FliS [Paludibacterium yongneupense]|uniref:flagellar export chaperone FliS n=1 Tax=Paludibacterium yongneupense TaxID=400061 RepID=UPI0003F4E1AF|nr:flagellar export chaperone FliS [Paludibacterium yongneupense]